MSQLSNPFPNVTPGASPSNADPSTQSLGFAVREIAQQRQANADRASRMSQAFLRAQQAKQKAELDAQIARESMAQEAEQSREQNRLFAADIESRDKVAQSQIALERQREERITRNEEISRELQANETRQQAKLIELVANMWQSDETKLEAISNEMDTLWTEREQLSEQIGLTDETVKATFAKGGRLSEEFVENLDGYVRTNHQQMLADQETIFEAPEVQNWMESLINGPEVPPTLDPGQLGARFGAFLMGRDEEKRSPDARPGSVSDAVGGSLGLDTQQTELLRNIITQANDLASKSVSGGNIAQESAALQKAVNEAQGVIAPARLRAVFRGLTNYSSAALQGSSPTVVTDPETGAASFAPAPGASEPLAGDSRDRVVQAHKTFKMLDNMLEPQLFENPDAAERLKNSYASLREQLSGEERGTVSPLARQEIPLFVDSMLARAGAEDIPQEIRRDLLEGVTALSDFFDKAGDQNAQMKSLSKLESKMQRMERHFIKTMGNTRAELLMQSMISDMGSLERSADIVEP
jgi:hypothetical protein